MLISEFLWSQGSEFVGFMGRHSEDAEMALDLLYPTASKQRHYDSTSEKDFLKERILFKNK